MGDRIPVGLLLTSAIAIVLAAGFGLTAIASIGSAIALVVFALVTGAHFRIHSETGARVWLLVLAEVCTVAVLVNFVVTTLVHEPGSMITIGVVLVVSIGLDLAWKRVRDQPPAPSPAQ
ncbi:MAG TPA: hypothetical protein VN648_34935 [Candidatus Methylomirabilis sp.]|nr:hypothetical protein [Candidatus Methylomirabilis sp.]